MSAKGSRAGCGSTRRGRTLLSNCCSWGDRLCRAAEGAPSGMEVEVGIYRHGPA